MKFAETSGQICLYFRGLRITSPKFCNVGLMSKASEEMMGDERKYGKFSFSTHSFAIFDTVVGHPVSSEPHEYPHKPNIARN